MLILPKPSCPLLNIMGLGGDVTFWCPVQTMQESESNGGDSHQIGLRLRGDIEIPHSKMTKTCW